VNRDQFLRVLRTHCRDNDLPAPRFDARRGKGGHGRVWIGERFATIPSGELATGTMGAILKQLGLAKDAV
jgi:hypothetical protein